MRKHLSIIKALFSLLLILILPFPCDATTVIVKENGTSRIKNEYIVKHSELNELTILLKQTEEMHGELINKYQEFKKQNYNPNHEDTSISLAYALKGDDLKAAEEFQKLPWSGWSANWSKQLEALKQKTQSVSTTCPESAEAKRQMLVALSYLFNLRFDYGDLLKGKNPQMDIRLDFLNDALKQCGEILSLDAIMKPKQSELYTESNLDKSSDYNSGVVLGRWFNVWSIPFHIVVIRKSGEEYFIKKIYEEGNSSEEKLSVTRVAGEERLTDKPGNSSGAYMVIAKDGWLNYYDKEGFLYRNEPRKEQPPFLIN
ncbi:MAG: hypothetical protein ABH891_07125 [Candidatus Omnitrophota bacterium]